MHVGYITVKRLKEILNHVDDDLIVLLGGSTEITIKTAPEVINFDRWDDPNEEEVVLYTNVCNCT